MAAKDDKRSAKPAGTAEGESAASGDATAKPSPALLPRTLVPLLELAINRALDKLPLEGALHPRRVELDPEGIWVELAVGRIGPIKPPDLSLRLRLEIVSTTPERTEWRWQWGDHAGFSRLVGKGVSLVPRQKLDELAARFFGEGLRLEGERVILDHAQWISSQFAARRGK